MTKNTENIMLALNELKKGLSMKKILYLFLLFSCAAQAKIVSLSNLLPSNSANSVEFIKNFIKESSQPVILKFFATWCGPCQRMQKTVEGVDARFAEKITIININVDEYRALSNHYGIRKIPTLVYFKNSVQVNQTTYTPKETIIRIIDQLLQ